MIYSDSSFKELRRDIGKVVQIFYKLSSFIEELGGNVVDDFFSLCSPAGIEKIEKIAGYLMGKYQIIPCDLKEVILNGRNEKVRAWAASQISDVDFLHNLLVEKKLKQDDTHVRYEIVQKLTDQQGTLREIAKLDCSMVALPAVAKLTSQADLCYVALFSKHNVDIPIAAIKRLNQDNLFSVFEGLEGRYSELLQETCISRMYNEQKLEEIVQKYGKLSGHGIAAQSRIIELAK